MKSNQSKNLSVKQRLSCCKKSNRVIFLALLAILLAEMALCNPFGRRTVEAPSTGTAGTGTDTPTADAEAKDDGHAVANSWGTSFGQGGKEGGFFRVDGKKQVEVGPPQENTEDQQPINGELPPEGGTEIDAPPTGNNQQP